MLCSNCGIKDANFHYKHISGGQQVELHLCSECAKELGYIKEKENVIYFAGGCFWCITPIFKGMDGVINVISGYSGGKVGISHCFNTDAANFLKEKIL